MRIGTRLESLSHGECDLRSHTCFCNFDVGGDLAFELGDVGNDADHAAGAQFSVTQNGTSPRGSSARCSDMLSVVSGNRPSRTC